MWGLGEVGKVLAGNRLVAKCSQSPLAETLLAPKQSLCRFIFRVSVHDLI